MKKLVVLIAVLLSAQSAFANACKVYHDECVQEGVIRGNGRVHQCEKEKAEAMNNQSCLLTLQKQRARHLANVQSGKSASGTNSRDNNR